MVRLPPRRTPRTWLRAHFTLSPRDIDGWNDLTDRMQPPIEFLHTFLGLHTEVRSEHLPLLWEAFLQWVRVHGRFDEFWWPGTPAPSSRLCQPSLAVDDLWRLLAGHTIAWRELPEQVQVMERVPVREPHSRTNLYERTRRRTTTSTVPHSPCCSASTSYSASTVDGSTALNASRTRSGGGASPSARRSQTLGVTLSRVGPACTRSLGSPSRAVAVAGLGGEWRSIAPLSHRGRHCRRGVSTEERSCLASVVGVVLAREAVVELGEQPQIGLVLGRGQSREYQRGANCEGP